MNPRAKKVLFLTVLMGTCFTAGVFASDGIEKVDAFLRPDFQIVLDGQDVELDTPALIYDDKSYLPLKAIAGLVNVDVKWEERSKTIYLNTRYPGQPVYDNSADEAYAEIQMKEPYGYNVTYLGGKYQLLSIRYNSASYFRVEDLVHIGLDVRALKKAREKYTGALYAQQDEVMKLWKQMPAMNMSSGPVIVGEPDQEKVDMLRVMAVETIPFLGRQGAPNYSRNAYIFAIDPVPEKPDWYFLYSREDRGDFFVYVLEMAQDDNGKWYQRSVQKIALDYLQKFKEGMQ